MINLSNDKFRVLILETLLAEFKKAAQQNTVLIDPHAMELDNSQSSITYYASEFTYYIESDRDLENIIIFPYPLVGRPCPPVEFSIIDPDCFAKVIDWVNTFDFGPESRKELLSVIR